VGGGTRTRGLRRQPKTSCRRWLLTKLDGTAKGGIVFRVQQELGVPVKLVGLGEGPDDLAPFEPAAFVDALLG
jgi:fused signal recognition particle receptor